MDTIKYRNYKDLIEAEEIKKRWKEYTEERYKNDLNELDYYNGVVSYPEPDILAWKSRGPYEALLLIKLLKAMKFQQNYLNP